MYWLTTLTFSIDYYSDAHMTLSVPWSSHTDFKSFTKTIPTVSDSNQFLFLIQMTRNNRVSTSPGNKLPVPHLDVLIYGRALPSLPIDWFPQIQTSNITQGLFLVINYIILCFATSLIALTYLQFNFAMVTSTEVAYFSYIYSVIPPERYQRATGYVRCAMLTGYTFGATLGQLLISLADTSYFHVNTITLGIMSVAFCISLGLPMPQQGMFFKKVGVSTDTLNEFTDAFGGETDRGTQATGTCCDWGNIKASGKQMWESLKASYSSRRLVQWSLWWALATAGYGQVFNYVQLMWDHIEPSSTSSVYNGESRGSLHTCRWGILWSILVNKVKIKFPKGIFNAIEEPF